MAISNYGELKASVAEWLDRSDLSASIPQFVSLAEAAMNRRFAERPIRPLEKRATATIDSEWLPIPEDMLGVIAFEVIVPGDSVPKRLAPADPDSIARYPQDTAGKAFPALYVLTDEHFRFVPPPASGSSYTAYLTYWEKLAPLAFPEDTNWVLRDHPDAYLFGALAYAGGFIEDPARIQMFESRFLRVLDDIMKAYPAIADETPLRDDMLPMGMGSWR